MAGLLLATIGSRSPAQQTLEGRAVAVVDGDTLTVLIEGGSVTVSLSDVDAPELDQRHGDLASQALAGLVLQRQVRLLSRGVSGSGEITAWVFTNGTRVNVELVQRGHAWVYGEDEVQDDLVQAEADARAARRGLWADDDPVPPWEWRADSSNAAAGAR